MGIIISSINFIGMNLLNRVGLKVPTVEVWFEGLNVSADVQIGHRALPTLVNYTRNTIEVEKFVCHEYFFPLYLLFLSR